MIPPILNDNGTAEPLLILPIIEQIDEPTQKLQELLTLIGPQIARDGSDEGMPAAGEVTSQLRRLARSAQILQNARRVQCSAAREELDKSEEEVHAAQYEMEKIQAEIVRCRQYEPNWQDSDIISLEEFFKVASKEKLDELPAVGSAGYEDALAVMRLEFEVEDVKRREDLVAALTKEREELIKAKKDIKTRHEAVSVHIKDLYKSANAVSSKTRDVLKNAAAPTQAF